MKICPLCKTVRYADDEEFCLVCGTPLAPETDGHAYDAWTISLRIDFSVRICGKCGRRNPYHGEECQSCHELLPNVDGPTLGEIDPIVLERRRALDELLQLRESMQLAIEGIIQSVAPSSEEEQFHSLGEFLQEFQDRTKSLREIYLSTDFSADALETNDFETHVHEIEQRYHELFDLTRSICEITPLPTLATLYSACEANTRLAFRCYLDLITVLVSENYSQAQSLVETISRDLHEAGDSLQKMTNIAMAGLRMRTGLASTPSEAIALVASEDNTLSSWQEKGWMYFADVFDRSRDQLSPEHGFQLAVWAVAAESFNDPSLFRNRVAAIAGLLRRANCANQSKLLSATSDLQNDILHASRLGFNVAQQIIATDFSRLHIPQLFDIAVHIYQRFSEGTFKNLLTVLLFAERLTEGGSPDYDEIKRRNFGPKVKRLKPSQPKSLADSSVPLIADFVDDLEMYVRHADAHCDFELKQDRILVNERDHQTKRIVAIHEYGMEEFITLIRRLMEAVSSILIGIICFQIEHHEDYLTADSDACFDYEKLEYFKYIFAAKGIVVESIDQTTAGDREELSILITAYLATAEKLTLNSLVPPLGALAVSFPDAIWLSAEFQDCSRAHLGKLDVPVKSWRFPGNDSERGRQLRLLELSYKILTQWADPTEMFADYDTAEQTYFRYILKALTLYLMQILSECATLSVQSTPPTRGTIQALNRETMIIQKIVSAFASPGKFAPHDSRLKELAALTKDSIRELDLMSRRRSQRGKERLDGILAESARTGSDLLTFIIGQE